jgi:hypothetical protein
MTNLWFKIFCISVLFIACNQVPAQKEYEKAKQETTPITSKKQWVEGTDYTVLKRIRVEDHHGFAQPIIAYSILLPKGWTSLGGITWLVGNTCMNESVSNRLTAFSPDKSFQIDFYPIRSWEWADDQMTMQSLQNNAAMGFKKCDIMEPVNADQYVRGEFARELGNPQILSIKTNKEVSAVLEEQARKNSAYMQAAGVNTVEYKPSAVTAILNFQMAPMALRCVL